jgi:hypothetical protein
VRRRSWTWVGGDGCEELCTFLSGEGELNLEHAGRGGKVRYAQLGRHIAPHIAATS